MQYCVSADRTHVVCVQYTMCTVLDERNGQYNVLDKYQCVEGRTSCATSLMFVIENEEKVT